MREIFGRGDGAPPKVDLDHERRIGQLVRTLIERGLVNAAHDVSDGGLLVCIAEMALSGNLGAEIDLADLFGQGLAGKEGDQSVIQHMFSERQGRVMVTVPAAFSSDFWDELSAAKIEATPLGEVYGSEIRLSDGDDWVLGTIPLADLRAAHEGFFPKLMGSELTPDI
jgi:phosphoribosylformylglycinamidine synthase